VSARPCIERCIIDPSLPSPPLPARPEPTPAASYYGDGVFILRPEIMGHIDYQHTCTAGTFHNSGGVTLLRPWVKVKKDDETSTRPAFQSSMVQPALLQDWATWTAAELASVACFYPDGVPDSVKSMPSPTKPLGSVSLADVVKYHTNTDSHLITEAHLPPSTPLAFVERVIMPSNTFDKLTAGEQKLLRDVFPDAQHETCLQLTKPVVGADRSEEWFASVGETADRAFEFMAAPPRSLALRGVWLTVEPLSGHRTVWLPTHVPRPSFHCGFRSVGARLLVHLSTKPPRTEAEHAAGGEWPTPPDDAQHFTLIVQAGKSAVALEGPPVSAAENEHNAAKHLATTPDIARPFSRFVPVSWHLKVADGTCTLRPVADSAMWVPPLRTLTFSHPALRDVAAVGFSGGGKHLVVEDANVSRTGTSTGAARACDVTPLPQMHA